MAEGGFENPGYEETPGQDDDNGDFHGANETTPFVPTSSSTPVPPSAEEIELAVRHLERGGGPETFYAETFGGRVTTKDIKRRFSAL